MSQDHFPQLFAPITLGKLTLRNRIVSTGHETHLNQEGQIGEKLIAYHEARARGGAGLIVTEVALVHPSAVFVADPIRVDSDYDRAVIRHHLARESPRSRRLATYRSLRRRRRSLHSTTCRAG